MTARARPWRAREGPDIPRLLRRAAEHDVHTRRLWCEAILRGYSAEWVARRLAELFKP